MSKPTDTTTPPSTPIGNTCGTCVFFDATIPPGNCLRFPPMLNPNIGWQYPIVTTATPSCGEYKGA